MLDRLVDGPAELDPQNPELSLTIRPTVVGLLLGDEKLSNNRKGFWGKPPLARAIRSTRNRTGKLART